MSSLYQFQYWGFRPPEIVRFHSDQILHAVMDLFPFEAFPTASIRLLNEVYVVDVVIKSIHGDFTHRAVHRDAFEALEKVYTRYVEEAAVLAREGVIKQNRVA